MVASFRPVAKQYNAGWATIAAATSDSVPYSLFMHQDAAGAAADLAIGPERTKHDPLHCLFHVGIVKDDQRRFAAQLACMLMRGRGKLTGDQCGSIAHLACICPGCVGEAEEGEDETTGKGKHGLRAERHPSYHELAGGGMGYLGPLLAYMWRGAGWWRLPGRRGGQCPWNLHTHDSQHSSRVVNAELCG